MTDLMESIDKAMSIVHEDEVDAAVVLWGSFDTALHEGRFEEIDQVLQRLTDLDKYHPDVVFSLLTILWVAKGKLPSHGAFVQRAEPYLRRQGVTDEDLEGLL